MTETWLSAHGDEAKTAELAPITQTRYSGNRQNKVNSYNNRRSSSPRLESLNYEDKKIMKYQDLILEIQKPWGAKIKVIPIIVKSLGAFSMNFEKHLWKIHVKHNSTALIKSAYYEAVISNAVRMISKLSGRFPRSMQDNTPINQSIVFVSKQNVNKVNKLI